MNEEMLRLVTMVLLVLVPLFVEVAKLLTTLGAGKYLTGTVKLKVTLVTSFILALVGLAITGQLDLPGLVAGVLALIQHPPGFWEFFPALFSLLERIIAAFALVTTVGQVVYSLLRDKLKEVGWLQAAYEKAANGNH